jgi:hypothetical protein
VNLQVLSGAIIGITPRLNFAAMLAGADMWNSLTRIGDRSFAAPLWDSQNYSSFVYRVER